VAQRRNVSRSHVGRRICFQAERVTPYRDDFAKVFNPVLEDVCSLMDEQIQRCAEKNIQVDASSYYYLTKSSLVNNRIESYFGRWFC
jgi:hypothetical protein